MKILKITLAMIAFVLSTSVNAALIERLGGLAYYDDVADLTWLADANAAAGSAFDTYNPGVGRMNWTDANSWAASLNIDGVTGWRLPDTLIPDASCSTISIGVCTGSEMGDLFYNVLGGASGSSITTVHNANYVLFSNVRSDVYWSSTSYANPNSAYGFRTHNGYQSSFNTAAPLYAWAVH